MQLPSLHHRLSHPSTPLLYPVATVLLGTFLGICHPESGIFNTTAAFLALLAAVIFLVLRRFTACALTVCFAVGWFNAELHAPVNIPTKYQKGSWTFSGHIDRINETETSSVTDVIIDSMGSDIDNIKAVRPIKIQLTIAGFDHRIAPASRIRWSGNLADSHALRRLAMMDDISRHARRRGIAGAVVIRPDAIVSVTDEPGILNALYRFRGRIAAAIYETSMSPSTTEFLTVVLLGDTEMLTAYRREAYSSAGLSHILALSGMHVAVIGLLISIALCPLLVMRWRKAVIIITVISLWLYAAITGYSPSVTRAVIMATVFAGARLLQRRSSPYNSLCLAAMIIVLADPFSLMSYGFQLSFAAVASIIAFAKAFVVVNPRRRSLYHLNTYIAVPVAAMTGTGLIACYYFHTFPIYFVPAAIVASILLPIICVGGAIATILNTLHLSGIIYGSTCFVTDHSVNILDRTAQFVSSLPGALLNGIELGTESLILLLMAVIALGLYINLRKRAYGYASLLLAATGIVCNFIQPRYPYEDISAILIPDRSFTTLLVRDRDAVTLYTDATGADTILVKQRAQRDFDTFLRLTGVDNITVSSLYNMTDHRIHILEALDSTAFSHAISQSDPYLIISGRATTRDIRTAPWHMLSGLHIKVIPSPALRPRMASMVIDKCQEYGIPTSDTLVVKNQSMSIKSLGI